MRKIMDKELFVFSNQPEPPVKEFVEEVMGSSEYAELSDYMHPDIAFFPNHIPFENFKEDHQEYIDFFKQELKKAGLSYDFIHIYTIEKTEYNPPVIENEIYYYKWDHKEFNLEGKRKHA